MVVRGFGGQDWNVFIGWDLYWAIFFWGGMKSGLGSLMEGLRISVVVCCEGD